MNTANHPSQDDLALFALQLLSEQEHAAILAHLRTCTLCREQVGGFEYDLALYAMLAEEHVPPASARERLLRSLANEPQHRPEPVPAKTPVGTIHPFPTSNSTESQARYGNARSYRTPVAWLGWAMAAVFALVAALQFQVRQRAQTNLAAAQTNLETAQAELARVQENATHSKLAVSLLADPGALNVALHQPSEPAGQAGGIPQGRAAYLPDRGALVFVASNLQPLKPYKVYELWLLPADANTSPIAAGSFRPDAAGNANIILHTSPKFVPIKGFGVTQEDDGSAPKKPTLPILLMGSSKA